MCFPLYLFQMNLYNKLKILEYNFEQALIQEIINLMFYRIKYYKFSSCFAYLI